MRWGLGGTSVRGPESQEEAHESQKGLIVLDILFWFFLFFPVFSTQILNFERSLSLSPGPKAVLFRLAKFILEALTICREYLDMIKTGNGLFRSIGLPVENNTDL